MELAERPFALHPDIRVDELREEFSRTGCVQVHPFIEDESAESLRTHLLARSDWKTVFRVGKASPIGFDPNSWNVMSENERDGIRKLVAQGSGFRYLFEEIGVIGNDFEQVEPGGILKSFGAFLSSRPVLELVRQVTGERDISRPDARATRYGPGHFLSIHNDDLSGSNRRTAYVFGLTRDWHPEWGGLLLFHDEEGDPARGLVPRMNTLNLFAVPKSHSVSVVAPFVPRPRLAITGWFRADRSK